jgi:hypothetical protein
VLFPERRQLLVLVFVVVAAAVIGYLAGHGQARPKAREQALTASVAGVILAVPQDWQQGGNAPPIPGFSLQHQIVLAPDGEVAKAGLVAGELAENETGPLPKGLLASTRGLPASDVVNLLEVQAYRYTKFNLPGYGRELTVYVVPNPGGAPTALACYADPSVAAYMRTCQHVADTLTLSNRTQSYDLTPQATYASGLSTAIAALERVRVALRRSMSPRSSPETVAARATRLAGAFAAAGSSLAALEPSLVTGPAQAALARAIQRAQAAYTALASAAQTGDEAGFLAAREEVARAESAVDEALEGFALLGYRPV